MHVCTPSVLHFQHAVLVFSGMFNGINDLREITLILQTCTVNLLPIKSTTWPEVDRLTHCGDGCKPYIPSSFGQLDNLKHNSVRFEMCIYRIYRYRLIQAVQPVHLWPSRCFIRENIFSVSPFGHPTLLECNTL